VRVEVVDVPEESFFVFVFLPEGFDREILFFVGEGRGGGGAGTVLLWLESWVGGVGEEVGEGAVVGGEFPGAYFA
jgi:hypothetical protein